MSFEKKIDLLQEINSYARAADSRVKQVNASLAGSWQAVQIMRADGTRMADIRPLVRINVWVAVEENGRMESGGAGAGGRVMLDQWLTPESWQSQVDLDYEQNDMIFQDKMDPGLFKQFSRF